MPIIAKDAGVSCLNLCGGAFEKLKENVVTANQSPRHTIALVATAGIEQDVAQNGRIIPKGLGYINYLRKIGDNRHSFRIGAPKTTN